MKTKPVLITLWITCVCVLASFHFVHLSADFPNYSRWMDWAKYTDEGWYANAAIQHYLTGQWHVPGDLNTAVAVPVWPAVVWLVFHFTGVSIEAARALVALLFCGNLWLSFLFVRRSQPNWVALFACSLIATSSFLWCFSRLAILEPLLTFLALTALLLGREIGGLESPGRTYAAAALLGTLLCAMILTKTTAVFLLPAVSYSVWHPLRKHWRNLLPIVAVTSAVAIGLWCIYFFAFVHPHYLPDYRYFFRMNVYAKPHTWKGWIGVAYAAAHAIFWIGRGIIWAGAVLLVTSIAVTRQTWQNAEFVSSLLAVIGYLLFVTDINNVQPRYYAVIAIFLCFAIAIALGDLLRANRKLGLAVMALCIAAMAKGTWEIGGYLLYPEYTFVNAAKGITAYVGKHPNGNRLLVSVSGNDISLITGLPSICDDFGTMPLQEKIALYKPGWYAAWDDLDPVLLADLRTQYSVEAVAAFNAFDDDDRDTLVLYKLIPARPGTSYYKNEIYHQMP
jgi:4-amino-4-deoxy-L-arabinose transferase-like glycosyltransferase